MVPHERISYWLAASDHRGFIERVNEFESQSERPSALNPEDKRVIDASYRIIHDYLEINLIFFNPQDALLLQSLADRVSLLGKEFSCKDCNEDKLYLLASHFRNLNVEAYTIKPEEVSKALPAELGSIISSQFSLMNILQILSCGQPVDPLIIKKCLENLTEAELNNFLNSCCFELSRSSQFEALRRVGCKTLKHSRGKSLGDQDKTIMLVRTFCETVKCSKKADELFLRSVRYLFSNAKERQLTVKGTSRQLILNEITKFTSPGIANIDLGKVEEGV